MPVQHSMRCVKHFCCACIWNDTQCDSESAARGLRETASPDYAKHEHVVVNSVVCCDLVQ